MGYIISFINLKGGVGKTTCCANIAGELAQGNRKILVIDADAQANISTLLLNPPRYQKIVLKIDTPDALENTKNTVYQIFLDEIDETKEFDPETAILKNVVEIEKQGKKITPLQYLDLLPASHELMQLEQKIVTYSRTRFIILHKALQKLKNEYDFILIDCPPNIYTATHNALYASDFYIIPTTPEFLSLTGIPLLIRSLNKTIAIKREEKYEAVECAGILINMLNRQLKIHQEGIKRIKLALDIFKKKNMVDKKARVFDTMITNKVDVKKAAGEYTPICVKFPKSNSTAEYRNLCAKILDRISESEG
ncbi:MAG: ParA family protein [Promethearchaeota archaeon]